MQCKRISYKNPFTSPLNEFVQQHPNVCQHEAADVEAEELGGVAGAELETDLSFVGMSKSRVFDLTCDLI